MADEKEFSKHGKRDWNGPSSAIYGLGFIGALIYFIVHATSFWSGMLGVLKAIIWPVLLIYKLLEFLNM